MTQQLARLLLLLVLMTGAGACADDAKPATTNPDLAAADQLYKAGKFAEAADKYQAVIKAEPKLIAAQVGLIRSLLREQKVEDAFTTAASDIVAVPDSPPLLAAMGAVHFRKGQMPDAETSYLQALKLDPKLIPAYLGLVRIYRAYSLYGHAYEELKRAHEIAPNDPEVQRMWFSQLPRNERIAAMEAFLADPHGETPEEIANMRRYLDFLKASADRPAYACKLVSKVEHTDTKLETMRKDPQHIVGAGLMVKLNDRDARLILDTGASGITVGRKLAEKVGLQRIADVSYFGVGDKGTNTGYIASAANIRVGDLEFENCLVHVNDRVSMTQRGRAHRGGRIQLVPDRHRPSGPEAAADASAQASE